MPYLTQIFSEHKESILEALKNRLKENPISDENGFSLIDGFMELPVYKEFSESTSKFHWGGPFVPIVGIVGTSGRIYLYPVKSLIPTFETYKD